MIPKLSVVIPCYNMGEYVDEALKSVLSYPTQNDIEVIIINDGSNDNNYTKKILDSYNFDNVFVIHQSNKGLGNARNTGIKLAKSPFLISSLSKVLYSNLKFSKQSLVQPSSIFPP